MQVTIVSHPSSLAHDPGPGHPERAERIRALEAALAAAPFAHRLQRLEPGPAKREDLLRVHSASHVDRVLATAGRAVRFDSDTSTSPGSVEAALYAAGGALAATARVLDDPSTCALTLMRPPGHHAERSRAMGFCLFNNVAVAAAYARDRGVERVLIFDPDVHHGNGTQDIFAADPHVWYVSFHQHPHYPGSGMLSEIGHGAGSGTVVNVPLPSGCDDADYAALAQALLPQIFARVRPELVLISLGLDAHARDPLGGMFLSAAGFCATLAPLLAAARATRVPLAMVLEGGYDLSGLTESVTAIIAALLDDDFTSTAVPPTPAVQPLLRRLRALHPWLQ